MTYGAHIIIPSEIHKYYAILVELNSNKLCASCYFFDLLPSNWECIYIYRWVPGMPGLPRATRIKLSIQFFFTIYKERNNKFQWRPESVQRQFERFFSFTVDQIHCNKAPITKLSNRTHWPQLFMLLRLICFFTQMDPESTTNKPCVIRLELGYLCFSSEL